MSSPTPSARIKEENHACCNHGCEAEVVSREPTIDNATGAAQGFHIANMDCATEENEIRHALKDIQTIQNLRFDLQKRVLWIDADAPVVEQALAEIRRAGFKPEALTVENAAADANLVSVGFWKNWGKQLVSLALALAAELIDFIFPQVLPMKILGMVLAATAIWLAGFSVYAKGLMALRRGRLNINALMTVAVTGAFLIGQWPEAAMVMALYAIAEAIEARAFDRARNAIKSLLALAPEQAEVRQADGSWQRINVKQIAIDSTVRIRPGERIPLDGVISEGLSALDQSPVTGESMPIDKMVGDEVYAGTINQTGALEVQVTATASDSTLARIIHAVEQAQSSRAPTQRFIDRFAAIYTPTIFILALTVVLLTPWLMHITWLQAIYKALVLLVIACPCALVISTPVTVVSGLAAGARRGILIKGGVYLEDARRIKALALDKTGTLTEGKPKLVAFEVVAATHSDDAAKVIAKSLATRSDHPVSKAITNGLEVAAREIDAFKAVAGRGVQASIDGEEYVLANHRWIEERRQCSNELESQLKAHEEAGRTVTLLANSQRAIAIFAVADTLKATSAQAIAELKALGVVPVMLTGDNIATARAIATQAGIQEVRGNLLPEEKLQVISELQQRIGPTAMSGDGINDAPALAKADIGFAMGGAGTHTAMEAADVVVMNDNLRRLPETIRLSQRAHTILWQNIALALGIKSIFLLLAIFDNASMWMAVFADMGASLLVIFNGLRLQKISAKNQKKH